MDPQALEVAKRGVDQPVTVEGWEPHEVRRDDMDPVVPALLRAGVPRVQRAVVLDLDLEGFEDGYQPLTEPL